MPMTWLPSIGTDVAQGLSELVLSDLLCTLMRAHTSIDIVPDSGALRYSGHSLLPSNHTQSTDTQPHGTKCSTEYS